MGASYDFWNLECRHPGILESPRFGWFLLITMCRVFFPPSFCPWTWFSLRNSKILSFLESSWNYLELWNSSGNGLFIAKFDIEGINWTYCNDFSHIWEHLLFFETCKPDIQKCWNPLDLACYYQCQCIWYFSHSMFVLELDFQCRISKFHHSWKLPEIFWNSGYCPGIGYF